MVEICDVEPTGNVAKADIKQTSQVKEGDIITGVLGNSGKLEYIAGAECVYFAADVVKKVVEVEGQVRVQLERPRAEVTSFKHKHSHVVHKVSMKCMK